MNIMAAVLFKDGVERQYAVGEYAGRQEAEAALATMMETFTATMNEEDVRYIAVGSTMILLEQVVAINFGIND